MIEPHGQAVPSFTTAWLFFKGFFFLSFVPSYSPPLDIPRARTAEKATLPAQVERQHQAELGPRDTNRDQNLSKVRSNVLRLATGSSVDVGCGSGERLAVVCAEV